MMKINLASGLSLALILAVATLVDEAESIFFGGGSLTLTIPALTGTAGAAALLGGLGALKLGVLAGAALARGRGGGKSRSKGYSRKGRSTTKEEDKHENDDKSRAEAVTRLLQPEVLGESPDGLVVDLEPTFRNLEIIDRFDCAKVIVCKIFAVEPSTLNEDHSALRSIFETQEDINLLSAMSSYQLAARLGQVTADESACSARYAKCGHDFSKDQLLKNFV